jgi:organic radical activating enzyme
MPKTIYEAFPNGTRRILPEDEPRCIRVAECFSRTVQGEGRYTGHPATFLRVQGCTLNCHWCFHENTIVNTKDGKKRIKDIKEGDVVYTLDPKTNKLVLTTVNHVLISKVSVSEMMSIHFSDRPDNPIICTKDHLFYVKNKGWVEAQNITSDDIIISLNNKEIQSLSMKENNPMYDESVKNKVSNTIKTKFKNGEIVPYFRTDELRKKESVRMKENNPMYDPEVVKNSSMNRFRKKSSLELKAERILLESGVDIEYVGNNTLCIGNKNVGFRFPDFKLNGENILIEVYDTTMKYVIGSERKYRTSEWEDKTRNHYQKFGYKTIFLTEKDLKISNLENIKTTIFQEVHNGRYISKINYDLTNRQKARLFGTSDCSEVMIDVYNLSCGPHDTYLVDGCLVHNCDTAEVWRNGNPKTITEIVDAFEQHGVLDDFKNGHHLILTGGSPLRQQAQLTDLVYAIEDRMGEKPFVEVETECTLAPTMEFAFVVDRWNCSPKLANSGMKRPVRYKEDVLRIMAHASNADFKFVVTNEEEWNEIVKDFIEPFSINKKRIFLMPEGQTREELQDRYDWLVDLACREGVQVSDRLHVTMWNKKTGV